MSAIYEYAAADVFELLESTSGAAVSVSFFELSGDRCYDMLNMFEPAQLLTGRDGSVHAFPLVEVRVSSAADLLAMIDHGRAVRSTAATGVNDTSSRSHAILRVYISPTDQMGGADEGVLTLGKHAQCKHILYYTILCCII
jgi:kinesin family protein 2/24